MKRLRRWLDHPIYWIRYARWWCSYGRWWCGYGLERGEPAPVEPEKSAP